MIFIIIVAIIIIIFIIYYFRKEKLTNDYSCGCVFDLDDTLTCGQERAKEAINYCKSKGCKISINTARPTKWYSDIKLSQLDLSENDFNDDFYHYDTNNNCTYSSNSCLQESIANNKVKHLQTFSRKWNIKPNKIVLFDDQISNIKFAKNAGFSAIHANHINCGIPNNISEALETIF